MGNCHKEEIDENKKKAENKDGNGISIKKVAKRKTEANYKNGMKFFLLNEELKSISENKMVTNESINVAQNMLKKQFPQFSGCDTVKFFIQMFEITFVNHTSGVKKQAINIIITIIIFIIIICLTISVKWQ